MKLDKKLRTIIFESLRDFNNSECVKIRRNVYEDEAYDRQIEECKNCPLFVNSIDTDLCTRLITLYDSMNEAFNTTLVKYQPKFKKNKFVYEPVPTTPEPIDNLPNWNNVFGQAFQPTMRGITPATRDNVEAEEVQPNNE